MLTQVEYLIDNAGVKKGTVKAVPNFCVKLMVDRGIIKVIGEHTAPTETDSEPKQPKTKKGKKETNSEIE